MQNSIFYLAVKGSQHLNQSIRRKHDNFVINNFYSSNLKIVNQKQFKIHEQKSGTIYMHN